MARQKHTILIIDDEHAICNVLSNELRDQGYLCSIAFNGNDALTELLTRNFDVALVDIGLPDMSGLELLRQVHTYHCNVVVIILSAINDIRTVIEAIKLGAADYIVKPFSLHEVNTSILSSLNAKKQLAQQGHIEESLRAVGGEKGKLDADR